MQPVFRFAPSPNGHLHLGHAYSALLNARLASERGGRFLIRIEDIDTARCTDGLVTECLEDLDWLGVRWEQPVLRQSSRFEVYRAEATKLAEKGLLYPCFCTRSDITRASSGLNDPDGAPRYPGTCREISDEERLSKLAQGMPHALRLDMGKALGMTGLPTWQEEGEMRPEPVHWGDVIIVRKDIGTSYHLAVVIDDAMQGITHVVRGMDLFAQTAIHRVLQTLLGLPEPVYHHHRLVLDEDGRKLAKSAVSTPLRRLRAEGWAPQAIKARLGF